MIDQVLCSVLLLEVFGSARASYSSSVNCDSAHVALKSSMACSAAPVLPKLHASRGGEGDKQGEGGGECAARVKIPMHSYLGDKGAVNTMFSKQLPRLLHLIAKHVPLIFLFCII